MADGEYRHKNIPTVEDIPEEEQSRFEVFLGEQYIGEKLDEEISAFSSNPGSSDELNHYIKEALPLEYEKKRDEVIKFLKDEIFSILSELKLLKEASHISIFFEKRKYGGAGITVKEDHSFLSIDIVKITLLILKDSDSEDLQANIVHDLSHEFFHKYIADHYKQTDERTRSANAKNIANETSQEYQRDRGEIASELYAAHHLEQRGKQEMQTDSALSQAFARRAERIRNEVKSRTTDTEKAA